MAVYEPNQCYACKKLFCCMDCCSNHIRNKHPGRESECPLCRSEILIVHNFNNPNFLCHIAINHLPLHCRSCGDVFECSSDLKTLGKCSRRLLIKKNNIVNENHSIVTHTPSPLNKTPVNPVNQPKGYSIEGDFNTNFDCLTSPPEFTRHTSTPMHIGLSRQSTNIIFKTPRSPNFSLKTPKTPLSLAELKIKQGQRNENSSIKSLPNNQELASPKDNNPQELSKECESIYLSFPSSVGSYSDKTPLKSILLSRSAMGDRNSSSHSQTASPSESSERRLEAMEELQENEDDMELTNPIGHIHQSPLTPIDKVAQEVLQEVLIDVLQDVKDSSKRVRFSDQFEIKVERESPNKSSADADEFYEARQSLSEFSGINFEKSILLPVKNEENQGKSKAENSQVKNEESRDLIVFDESLRSEEHEENKENIVNTKIEEKEEEEEKEPIKSKGSECEKNKVSSSSRVVMMVLVEKTGDSQVDLAPLIDSGLETLKNAASNVVSMASPKELVSPASSGSYNTPRRLSVVSVNSYTSVSSIECFEKSASSSRGKPEQEKSQENSSTHSGLFSAVANAVRTAFKNITEAVSTKSIVSGQLPIKMPVVHEPMFSRREMTLLPSKPVKRSREEDLRAFSESGNESSDTSRDIRSPEQKRHRAWYRQIRGRDPIARMKNSSINSSRGISSETQCFQQGSLSIGNTVLPLPARAHQATQTDN